MLEFATWKRLFEDDGQKIVIFDRTPPQYGKTKISLPHGIERSEIIEINRLIDAYIDEFNRTAPPERQVKKAPDNYGNVTYPRYKYFQRDKDAHGVYWVHPTVMNKVLNLISTRKGLGVERESARPQQQPIQAPATQPIAADDTARQWNKDVEVLGLEDTPKGKKIAFRFNIPFRQSKAAFEAIKPLGEDAVYYTGRDGIFHATSDNPDVYKKVREGLVAQGLDLSHLDEFVKANKLFIRPAVSSDLEKAQGEGDIQFFDEEGDAMKIRPMYYNLQPEQKRLLKELIPYTFPEHEWLQANGRPTYTVKVHGNYKQYALFGKILRNRFFGGNKEAPALAVLRKIIQTKMADGRMERDRYEGEFPKHPEEHLHQGKDHEEIEKLRKQHFLDTMEDRLPHSKIDYYDDQKDGVAFLYARDHALLGDETGAGKTAQMIGAAALKSQDVYGDRPILIFTHNEHAQQQWAKEIVNILGDGEQAKISTNPLYPNKWTIVRYSNFERDKDANERVKNSIQKLRDAKFGIVMFDEVHKLKHGDTRRAANLSEVVENIPTRWGASATVSSNKPIDVRGQLNMINHHLGRINARKFAKEFAGEEGHAGRNLSDDEKFEKQVIAAERLNKWLNLSGVYSRKTKDDLRASRGEKMPPLSVKESNAQFNPSHFSDLYTTKLNSYENPRNPLSKLIAARSALAEVKTDDTTRQVLNIVNSNKENPANNYAASKVVVFTNFTASAHQLITKLDAELKKIDPNFKVIAYVSDVPKRDRMQIKNRFTNDPNAKVLVMSMKMGGTGVDFPNAAQNMVVNDFDWTPESAEQSEGRIYRINTNHPVDINYMVSNGIDRRLFEKVKKKRELAAIVQRYRKVYEEARSEAEEHQALDKIVDTMKQIKQVDNEMIEDLNDEFEGAGSAFRDGGGTNRRGRRGSRDYAEWLVSFNALKEELCYGVSLL